MDICAGNRRREVEELVHTGTGDEIIVIAGWVFRPFWVG
jgi:hypothetical protein